MGQRAMTIAAIGVWLCTGATQLSAADITQRIKTSDTAMREAVSAATGALPLFLFNAVGADGVSVDGAAVKVAVKVDATTARQEVIWVTPFMLLDETFAMGELANAPKDIAGKALGDMIEFKTGDILDWSFQAQDQKLYGNFTSRVQLHDLDESYDWLRQALSDEPVPDAWRDSASRRQRSGLQNDLPVNP